MNRIIVTIFFYNIVFSQESICANPILSNMLHTEQREIICEENQFKIRSNVLQSGNSDSYYECVDFIYVEEFSNSSTHFYIEASEFNNQNISLESVKTLFEYFTMHTPNAEKNEYQNGIKMFEEFFFGLPPNKNNDNIINILILDIRDNFNGSGNYIAGYFDRNDQSDSYTSNQKDILYIDCNPVDMLSEYPEEALYTLAHEYEHLLHYHSDPNEVINSDGNFNPWLDEGLADLAPSILGLGNRNYGYYLSNTQIGLDEWVNNGLEYYGKSALFMRYLYECEEYGFEFINNIFNDDSHSSLESIKYWVDIYSHLTFNELFNDWVINTLTNSYPITSCISDVVQNNIINDASITSLITPVLPKYSFYNILIPSYLEKNELFNLDHRDETILHNYNTKNILEKYSSENYDYWLFPDSSYRYDYLYTFINHQVDNNSNEIEIYLEDIFSSNTLLYDDNVIDTFIDIGLDNWYAGIVFDIDTSAMITHIEYMAAKSKPINIKIKKGDFNYTSQVDSSICSPTGNGWNRINIADRKIFVNKESIYVVIEMNENTMGMSSNNNESNSYYSLTGNNYSQLNNYFDGNWAIRLSYIDTIYIELSSSDYELNIYPNPYNPMLDLNLSTFIYVEKHQKYFIDVYEISGKKIKNLFNDYPIIDKVTEITWDGKDSYGKLVSSGIYIIKHKSNYKNKSYFFTVIK